MNRIVKWSGAVVGAGLACSLLALSAQQLPRPAFRSGVDVVTLDVTVLDGNRRPVRGLTASDFRVQCDGEDCPIVGFDAIDLPDRARASARWLEDVTPDVSTNGFTPDRIVVLMLDDWNTSSGASGAIAVRKIALGIIDALRPSDLAAVVYAFQTNRGVDFTTDREKLRAAVNRFTVSRPSNLPGLSGACLHNSCGLDVMRAVATATRAWPDRRKLMAYIGPEGTYALGPQNIEQNASEANQAVDMTPALMDTFRELQRSNVTVYQFDPRGLEELLPGNTASGVDPVVDLPTSNMGMFADHTGGTIVTRTNAPWERTREMLAENDSYYMLGLTPSAHRVKSGFHPIRVTVNRPGVTVLARSGYYDPLAQPSASTARDKASTPLDKAMLGPVPAADLPLSLTVAPFRVPGAQTAAVAVVGGLDRKVGQAGPDMVDVAVRAFDENKVGRESKGLWKSTLRLLPQPSKSEAVHYDTLTRLDLPPGRYEVRLSMERASDKVLGGVTTFVTVPDFEKDPLSLSGVVLARLAGVPLSNGDPLSSVLPFPPTTRRTFTSGEAIGALVRVYQGGRDAPRPASIVGRIVNDADTKIFEAAASLVPAAFVGPTRSAEYKLRLPLVQMARGEYLLTIEASLGSRTAVVRDVRFRVK